MKFKLFAVSMVLILLLISGCATKNTSITAEVTDGPSPQNKIIAVINGISVYESGLNQYTETAKIYWQAVSDSCNKAIQFPVTSGENEQLLDLIQAENPNASLEDYQKLQDGISDFANNQAQKHLRQNEEEWKKEYYKTFVVDNKLMLLDSKMKAEALNSIDNSIQEDIEADSIPLPEVSEFFISDASSQLYVSNTLSELSKKFNLPKTECLDTILKPFLKSMCGNRCPQNGF